MNKTPRAMDDPSSRKRTMPWHRHANRLPALLLLGLGCTPYASGQSWDGCVAFVPPPWEAVTFDDDIQPIFDRHCVSCHQPGASGFSEHQLDLRPGQAYDDLVGQHSIQVGLQLVRPFHPDGPLPTGSYLWDKVSCTPPPVGAVMPPPPSRLSAPEMRALFVWMLRGAPPGADGAGRHQAIKVWHAGSWYDPSLPGHGFSLEVLPGSPSRLIAYWMTFDMDGKPRWFVGTGEFEDGESSVELGFFHSEGVFDFARPVPPRASSVGTGRLMFASCLEAWLHYDIRLDTASDDTRLQRTLALRRLTPALQCDASP